jgi:hypothetical protein
LQALKKIPAFFCCLHGWVMITLCFFVRAFGTDTMVTFELVLWIFLYNVIDMIPMCLFGRSLIMKALKLRAWSMHNQLRLWMCGMHSPSHDVQNLTQDQHKLKQLIEGGLGQNHTIHQGLGFKV